MSVETRPSPCPHCGVTVTLYSASRAGWNMYRIPDECPSCGKVFDFHHKYQLVRPHVEADETAKMDADPAYREWKLRPRYQGD